MGKVKLAKNAVTKKIFFFAKKTAKKFFAIFWGSKAGGFAFCTASGGVFTYFVPFFGLWRFKGIYSLSIRNYSRKPDSGVFCRIWSLIGTFSVSIPYLFETIPKSPSFALFPIFFKIIDSRFILS